MAIQFTNLTFDDISPLLEVGESVYYSKPVGGGMNFDYSTFDQTYFLGKITAIVFNGNNWDIVVEYDDAKVSLPVIGDYISSQQNKSINNTGLKGYYASIKLKNNSTKKAELFSIGAEISESSK